MTPPANRLSSPRKPSPLTGLRAKYRTWMRSQYGDDKRAIREARAAYFDAIHALEQEWLKELAAEHKRRASGKPTA